MIVHTPCVHCTISTLALDHTQETRRTPCVLILVLYSCFLAPSLYTHTLTPSHSHILTHTHTLTSSHLHTHILTHTAHTLTSSHLHTLISSHTRAHTLTSSHLHTLISSHTHPHTVVYQEAKCVELSQELAKGKEEVSSLNIKVKWAQNKLKTETEAHKVRTASWKNCHCSEL